MPINGKAMFLHSLHLALAVAPGPPLNAHEAGITPCPHQLGGLILTDRRIRACSTHTKHRLYDDTRNSPTS